MRKGASLSEPHQKGRDPVARKKVVVDQERYRVLKEMLEERRQEIQQKLRSLRETLPAETGDVRDAEEQSVDDFVQEVDFTLMQMKSETLAKIDEAISRLEAGTYVALLVTPRGSLEIRRLDEHYADEQRRSGHPARRD